MVWSEQLFRYCERGSDPSFWAEPINALTNLGFIIAAICGVVIYRRLPEDARGFPEAALIALVFVIGIGSFLFHTFATRWASLADEVPIGLFMLAYFAYALRRFLNLNWIWVGVSIVLFVGALWGATEMTCRPSFMPNSNALNLPCFNGTAGYLPALLALFGIGIIAVVRDHPAGRSLLLAGTVFAFSMAFRTFDFEICMATDLFGAVVGTHFLWHLLNAVVLLLLLRAALLHGGKA